MKTTAADDTFLTQTESDDERTGVKALLPDEEKTPAKARRREGSRRIVKSPKQPESGWHP
jgi:hypothetical protein